MPNPFRTTRTLLLAILFAPIAASADPGPDAQAVIASPDITFSGTYDLPCPSAVLDSLLGHPVLLARLWTAYGFAPAYRVREEGGRLHVEDPTGLAGEVVLAGHEGRRWVFLGDGALNHRLAPGFRGKVVFVLAGAPKGNTTSARLDAYIRTESRTLGLLAWSVFPLVRGRVENRITLNLRDAGTILRDIATAPQQTASRLGREDSAAFARMFLPSGK